MRWCEVPRPALAPLNQSTGPRLRTKNRCSNRLTEERSCNRRLPLQAIAGLDAAPRSKNWSSLRRDCSRRFRVADISCPTNPAPRSEHYGDRIRGRCFGRARSSLAGVRRQREVPARARFRRRQANCGLDCVAHRWWIRGRLPSTLQSIPVSRSRTPESSQTEFRSRRRRLR